MRRVVLPVLLLLAAACSSTPPTGTTPGAPASLTIVSGDGQSAAPGSIMSAKVSVLVKGASGTAVPGVVVHFAVDSGGGSIGGATATTGTDGIATAGDWTLGSAEGRNTLVAQAGALSVRLSATARYPTTDLADQSVAPGGSLTVTQPTSALNGLRIDVPAGAFAGPLALKVQSGSSLGIPHVPDITIGSPLITIESDAPSPAKVLLKIRIPAKLGPDDVPLVAIVDPVTGFLDALPTVDFDANGVTASIWSLDGAQYADGPSASLRALRAGTSPRMQLALFMMKANVLHTRTFDTGFLPGVDDWDFTPEPTSTWDQINNSGAAVTERYYFVTQKPSSGPLFGRFDIAKGVPSSNVSGMRWSATVSDEFNTLVQPFLAEAELARAANPVRYDLVTVQWIAASIFASNGRPQILALDDPIAGEYRTVLARSWDGPNGFLWHADPLVPGSLTKGTTWTSTGGFVCSPTCLVVVKGLNHLIQYATELALDWPFVLDNTINQGVGPIGVFESWSPMWLQTKYEIPDTLFMVNDTTRLWSECACSHWFPSSLPTNHGSPGIQSERAFVLSSSGGTPLAETFPGTPLDRSELSTTAWIDTQVGFEFRSLRDIANQFNSDTRWHGWRTFQVIKYALALKASSSHSGAPGVLFDLSTTGGPALSSELFYEFDWGDHTARGQFLGTHTGINHVYQADGHYTVEVFVKHPGLLDANGSMEVIGDVKLDIDLAGESIKFDIEGPWDPLSTPPNGSYTFAQSFGGRGPYPVGSGLDAVFLQFDIGSEISVLFGLFVQPGADITAGETFSKVTPGTVVAGQFNILLATDLYDPADPNSRQVYPGDTGTCTITSLAKLSDGTFVAHYSFSILNAAGGTISGSGVGTWK